MSPHAPNFIKPMLLGLICLDLFVVFMAAMSLKESRSAHEQAARASVENLSFTLERDIAGSFDKVDLVLQSLIDDFEYMSIKGRIEKQDADAEIFRQKDRLPLIAGLYATDSNGKFVYGFGPGVYKGVDISDREYFLRLRNNPKTGLVVSDPLFGRVTGKWSIVLARRFNKGDGSFGGVVAATIPLEHFQQMFAGLKLGTKGSIGFRDDRLRLIVRHPPLKGAGDVGATRIADDFNAALKANRDVGVYTSGATSIDGVQRIHSFRRNSTYAFFINVGFAEDDYLAQWRVYVRQTIIMVLLFVVVSVVTAWHLRRSWMQQQASAEQLRQNEALLRKSRELLDYTAEKAKKGGWEISLPSMELIWTKEIYRIYEVEPDFKPTIGGTIDFYASESKPLISLALRRTIESGVPFDLELILVTAKQNRRLVNAVGEAEWKGDKVVKVTGTFRDITEQRRLEEQLRQSHKLESVGQLAGGIAHDFNNKLAVIIGNAELALLELTDNHPMREYLKEILSASELSKEITGQLLAFSRQQVVSPRQIDVNLSISKAQSSLSRLISEEIAIEFIPGEEIWYSEIDPVQFDQIIMNLTVNARDAMPHGGMVSIRTDSVEIDKNSYPERNSGEYVRIIFSDNGSGMDKETEKHIFEPFYTTKGVGKGTGLGLATVYGIVAQNNGFIEVTSEPGLGSTFKVYLPRVIGTDVDESLSESSPLVGSGTILLVEDEESVRKTTKLMLEKIGYTVYSTEGPREALEKVENPDFKFDMLLTDVIMPDMSGKELADQISKIHTSIRVLYMSGYTSDMIENKDVVGKGINFIRKPFDISTLSVKIAETMACEK